MTLALDSMKSPVGPLYLVASEKGLRGVYASKPKLGAGAAPSKAAERMVAAAKKELAEYFAGKRSRFTVALDLEGTEFQKKVWAELRRIPFGKTISYRELAKNIRKPKAFRAVGNANGKNPACIIVPCHRVIAADGSLGGYSGGLPMKRTLLALERG
jgi:methylated-DNA-[protein]-cysteine S-methyltransferase